MPGRSCSGRGGRRTHRIQRRPSEDRPGAERRGRARCGPHRGHTCARADARAHRCGCGNQHGCGGRRALCCRPQRRRNRRRVPRTRLAGPAARPGPAQGPRLSSQAGRPQLPRHCRTRHPCRRWRRAATRPRAGPEDHPGAAQRNDGRGGRAGLRQAADAVSRTRDRPRERRSGGAALRRPRHGAAREHVGARRVCAGGDRRATAGGRGAGGQPARRPGARDGRGHRDRRGRELSARDAQRARDAAGRNEPDDRDHGEAWHRDIARRVEEGRRAGRAGTRAHDLDRLHADAAGAGRGREGRAEAAGDSRGAGAAAGRLRGLRGLAVAGRRPRRSGGLRAARAALRKGCRAHRCSVRRHGRQAAGHRGAATEGVWPVRARSL